MQLNGGEGHSGESLLGIALKLFRKPFPTLDDRERSCQFLLVDGHDLSAETETNSERPAMRPFR